MSRALLIQLARLGDLVQSLPVLTSLHSVHSDLPLDLVCPSPLVSLGELFPCVERVYPWKGEEWHELTLSKWRTCAQRVLQAQRYLSTLVMPSYALAYNLNNHPRGVFAAHILGDCVVGPGENGPLNPTLPVWASYLRHIAQHRGKNRIHLADAFCGMCRVSPPSHIPYLKAPEVKLPLELERIVNHPSSMTVGIILGAGDADRKIPLSVLQDLLVTCAERIPQCSLCLIGGAGEREAALSLENRLPSKYMNRVFNVCGRTSLPQLVGILNRCSWVVGSDTGPLHLGAMCGVRAIGWYFSRARVHETGPYGLGHYVWQHESVRSQKILDNHEKKIEHAFFDHWPVMETVNLMLNEAVCSKTGEWELWASHRDEWGAFYTSDNEPDEAVFQRKEMWKALSQLSA